MQRRYVGLFLIPIGWCIACAIGATLTEVLDRKLTGVRLASTYEDGVSHLAIDPDRPSRVETMTLRLYDCHTALAVEYPPHNGHVCLMDQVSWRWQSRKTCIAEQTLQPATRLHPGTPVTLAAPLPIPPLEVLPSPPPDGLQNGSSFHGHLPEVSRYRTGLQWEVSLQTSTTILSGLLVNGDARH